MLMIESNNNIWHPKIERKMNSRILLSNININYCSYFDEIQLDDKISDILYNNTKQCYNIFKVINVTNEKKINYCLIEFIENIDYNYFLLLDYFNKEALGEKTLNTMKNYNKELEINLLNSINEIICFECINDTIIFKNNLLTKILNKDFMLLYKNDDFKYIFIDFNKKTQTVNNYDSKVVTKYDKKNKMLYGFIKTNKFINKINLSINDNNEIDIKYNYDNYGSIKIISHLLEKKNGDYIELYNKNSCLIGKSYYSSTDTTHIISQCMINNNNGLRYRGKYTSESQNNKITKQTISINDKIEYNEEDGNVLVDNLERLSVKENEFIIGWKVVKSLNGEKRIIGKQKLSKIKLTGEETKVESMGNHSKNEPGKVGHLYIKKN
jgi:hypothetical protein